MCPSGGIKDNACSSMEGKGVLDWLDGLDCTMFCLGLSVKGKF